MKRLSKIILMVSAVFLITGLTCTGVYAEESAQAKMKSDKTGTNPVNFQRDIRLYNEYSWLNTAGDGSQNMTTLEFRTPLLDGKWQWRVRAPFKALEIDNPDGSVLIDESGFGDLDMRFLTVPVLDMANMRAVAIGLEVFLNTASEDVLGSGTTSLGPQVFLAKFFKGGLGPYKGGGMFAPGLQYKFSVNEDDGRSDTEQILIDLNLLVMATDKQSWFFTDPQIVFDLETEEEYAIVDLEFGLMMTKLWPDMKGHSCYIRPSFGVGGDRPTDGSVEVGYKMVGW
jgi:hypothetical protein